MEEVPRFSFIAIELSRNMNLISSKYILCKFFGFKNLIKDAAINHAAFFGRIVSNSFDSLMMQFQKDTFPNPGFLKIPSGIAIGKSTVVIGNGKASSTLKDRSTTSPNAWQSL